MTSRPLASTARILRRGASHAAGTILAAAVAGVPAHGQIHIGAAPDPVAATSPRTQGWYGGVELLVAQPLGAFHDHVHIGGGIGGSVITSFGAGGILALRADGGYLVYGERSFTAPFYGSFGLVDIDFTTTNAIFFLGAGPQLMAPNGRVRPYFAGTIGFASFFTETSARGSNTGYEFASTTNSHDATFAWTASSGLYVPLRGGPSPLSLDLGVRYHGNGRARYLTPGSIAQDAFGNTVTTPNESETRFLTYRLGVTLGTR